MAAAGMVPWLGEAAPVSSAKLRADVRSLLRDWTDGLVRLQLVEPAQPERHGAFRCPACNRLHGRCGDAVYPLLAMARLTGKKNYLEAAVRVVGWMKNVDSPDGAWTNEVDPKSWKGTTVFAALALAKSLQAFGDLLDASTRAAWSQRLRLAGEFIYRTFNFDFSNINYPLTATHALALLGQMFNEPDWRRRARELAQQGITFLTEPHGLIYGEGRPMRQLSPAGCPPVDLGYNVEESLPALLEYADLEADSVVRAAALRSLEAHLEFLLPDGAWDNSWGTRSFKWTYWGSRTSDGALAALLGAARERPVFWTAAERQLQLLRACTYDGLLYGGPHLHASQVPACVHHTFTHAKVLVDALRCPAGDGPAVAVRLPREVSQGLIAYPELATWLAASGSWRATVTRYDWIYHNAWHATGGALALLWHARTGPLLVSSLAKYVLVEANNMQTPPDGKDFPLTLRVEEFIEGARFSNLCDLNAAVQAVQRANGMEFQVESALCDESGKASGTRVHLRYVLTPEAVLVSARRLTEAQASRVARLVLPLVSAPGEKIGRAGEATLLLHKPKAVVKAQATVGLETMSEANQRVFNLVPGFAAVPLSLTLMGQEEASCRLSVQ
jgi:hypothetical protein